MSFKLDQVLIKAYQAKKLAPFYILKSDSETSMSKDFLETWLKEVLAQIIMQEKKLTHSLALQNIELGNADILWPKRKDLTKNYSIKEGDLDEVFRFMEFRALELAWRFVVIEDPDRLSPTYLNKLLKTLEEPAPNTSIIFLDHQNTVFLDTIHSRALEYTVSGNKTSHKWSALQTQLDLKSWLENRKDFFPKTLGDEKLAVLIENFLTKKTGLSELIEKVKTTPGSDIELAGLITELEADRAGRYKQKEKLCSELEWFQTSKTYNNAPWERTLGILLAIS